MSRVKIFAHGDRLSRIYPVSTAHLPRVGQDVDIIYTDDRTDPVWSADTEGSRGFIVRTWVSTKQHRLDGVFAIDLQQCLLGSMNSAPASGFYGELRRPSVDFHLFRRAVFETVAHEYFHLIQGWILILKTRDQNAMEQAYAAEQRHNERQLLADDVRWFFKPEQLSFAAYVRNHFESSARQMAQTAVKRLRHEIDCGTWDAILPIAKMKTLAKAA